MRSPLAQPAEIAAGVSRLLWLLPSSAVVLLYWPAFTGSFQFDDWNVIVHDPRVHSLAAWWESMPGIRPLLKLSYALNFSADSEPTGFRIVNVLIHALNATLVFWLLNIRGRRAGLTVEQAARAALLAAVLFSLHPVQTEAVTYISGRSASLAALFCLISLLCWTRAEASRTPRTASSWLAACIVSYVAAAACKETALVLPLALWLYSADRPVQETLRRVAPLLAVSLLMVVVALSLPRYRYLLDVSLETRSLGVNLLTQARAILYLAGQLIRIGHGNADPQLPVVAEPDALSLMLGVFWCGLLIAALMRVRTAPVGAFAVLWFLLWLAPTNSFLPRLDVANDRQLYLSLIGPAWWLSVQLLAWSRLPPLLQYTLAALLIVLLAHTTLQRNRVYATETTFWQDAAARNPSSARAANNLGMAYAIDCRFEEATEEFERSIGLDPQDFRARINLRLLIDGALPGVDPERCPPNSD